MDKPEGVPVCSRLDLKKQLKDKRRAELEADEAKTLRLFAAL